METSAQATVQIVKQIYADFGTGNIPGVLSKLDENVTWVDPGNVSGLYEGTRKGKQSVANFFNQLGSLIEVSSFDVKQLFEYDGTVYAIGQIGGTTRNLKKQMDTDWVMLWKFNDKGLVTFHQLYLD